VLKLKLKWYVVVVSVEAETESAVVKIPIEILRQVLPCANKYGQFKCAMVSWTICLSCVGYDEAGVESLLPRLALTRSTLRDVYCELYLLESLLRTPSALPPIS